jgi:major type 1 subunit fimbrin (pilin)
MKQIIIAAALALALGASATASAQAANGGSITFTGAVNDNSCTVRGGAGTDGGTGNFGVILDTVNPGQLATDGATAASKAFQVVIGGAGQATCADDKIASMSFAPTSALIDPVTGALQNSLSGEATNVQIQLGNGTTNAPIDLADPNNVSTATIAGNTATIPYFARYLATGAATVGLVSTNVTYAVTYN